MIALKENVVSASGAFTEALGAHRRWLATEGREGRRANLAGRDLRGVNLASCDLRRVSLAGCDLSGATLAGANLEGADLSEASLCGVDFCEANLKNARLYNADLEGADLATARFLRGKQLCGCNLAHAKLPPGIEFYGLEQAQQSAAQLAVQFVSMLTLCLYSWLTIGSTKDVDLLTNARSVSFPFIDLSLPILGFYLLVPIALPALSMAFYVHLSTYWDHVASLPAYFPDGSEVTARTPPMLLDRLVEMHMVRLSRRGDMTGRIYATLITLGLFGLVPLTLFAFWLRYLPRHDALGTTLQLVALFGFLVYAWYLNESMKVKLRLASEETGRRRGWVSIGFYAVACIVLSLLSIKVLRGSRLPVDFFYADLRGEAISKPAGDAAAAEPANGNASFYAVSLHDMNLRHANLRGAFAANVDFSRSRLAEAFLDRAVLRESSFRNADLRVAALRKAKLQSADLRRARLAEAALTGADLGRANFTQANLRHADLSGANVTGANFSRADLTGTVNAHGISGEAAIFALAQMQGIQLSRAQLKRTNFFLADLRQAHLWRASLVDSSFILADLGGANLTQADLTGCDLSQSNLRAAVLERATLVNAKLIAAHLYDAVLTEANLTGASLRSAQLRGASLRRARLTGADLGDAALEAADLDGADLRGVDLSQTTGLTAAQLARAVVDEHTILPTSLRPLRGTP